jgi:hypothetical protein
MISLPSSVQFQLESEYGIVLAGYPSTQGRFDFIIETATAAASTSWTAIVRAPPSLANEIRHTVHWPNDGKTRYFRAYQIAPGYAKSTGYTAVVSAIPKPIRAPFFAGAADILGSTATLGAALTKTLRVTAAQMQPALTTEKWTLNEKFLKPNVTGTTQSAFANFSFPVGVTITQVQWAALRTAVTSKMIGRLRRVTTTAASSILEASTLTTGAGVRTVTSSAMTELVTSTRAYSLQVQIKTTAVGAGQGAEFNWVELTYTMPRISAAY